MLIYLRRSWDASNLRILCWAHLAGDVRKKELVFKQSTQTLQRLPRRYGLLAMTAGLSLRTPEGGEAISGPALRLLRRYAPRNDSPHPVPRNHGRMAPSSSTRIIHPS